MIPSRLLVLDRFPAQIVRNLFRNRFAFVERSRCLAVVAVCLTVVSRGNADPPARPDFAKVALAVQEYFQSQPDEQRGDLLGQRQVRAALGQVAAAGWRVPGQEKIVGLALADNSFVVSELSTPEGRKFMRSVARHPGAYNRLDRLSTLENGQSTIRHLIEAKQGDDFITYLATTSGGKSLGKMMAGTQGGVDLNKPTGRIYTADDLLTVLKQIYDATP
jgi:hypothetical protein